MVVLIVLNIVLIITLIILVIYLFRNKKDSVNHVRVTDEGCLEIVKDTNAQNKNKNSERVFDGIFVTDEEYQQIMENKKSDISILLKEVDKEYEHLKELNK